MKDHFRDLDVLLDAHDLSMPDGTGIKSYGLRLISTLKHLGANPELLVSARSNSDPRVARAMLYDPAERNERSVEGWRRRWKARWHFNHRLAKHLPALNGSDGLPVPDTIFPYGLGCSVMFNCYRASRAIHEKAKIIPTFRTAKKYRVWHSTQPLSLRHAQAAQITTIHDLIPLTQPHLCNELRPMFYHRVREAVRNSRAIAVDSEYTRQDLLKWYPETPEDKVVVTHLYSQITGEACDAQEIEMTMKAFNLKRGNYILCVGTLDSRKNIRRLIEAYLTLDTGMALVLVGKPGWRAGEELNIVSQLNRKLGKSIRQLSYVPSQMLPALYQGASCLAFPSLYEGFGLPPLEAMISGCPVVSSSATSLPEVTGDAAHYVDPYSVESIAEGLSKVLGDPAYRETLIARGREQARHFSRERFAEKIVALYEKALA